MSANVAGMVREGINAYRAGRLDEARALLLKAVELDQQNEQAWLWLSTLVETTEEQRICLENVLVINPQNDRARKGLKLLAQQPGEQPPAAPPAVAEDDAFTVETLPAPNNDIPTSAEWMSASLESSSPSAASRVQEPSAQEYDDWLANLNLGAGAGSERGTGPLDSSVDDDLEDEARFAETDFAGPVPPDRAPLNDELTLFANAFVDGDVNAGAGPRKRSDDGRSTGILEDKPPRREIDDDDDDPLGALGALFGGGDDDDLAADDLTDFFQYIPEGIEKTRLPGTDERYPAGLVAGLIVLLVLNVALAAVLVALLV